MKLKDIEYSGKRGGARPNSGRPKGKMTPETLERMRVEKQLKSRIYQKAGRLFKSMLEAAEGESFVFRIDKGEKGKPEHNLVTDPKEIADFLNETEGTPGEVDGNYYYIKTKSSDWRAIEAIYDRGFGKSNQNIEVDVKVNKYDELSEDELIKRIADILKTGTIDDTGSPGEEEREDVLPVGERPLDSEGETPGVPEA